MTAFWLQYIAAFLIVIGALMVGVGIAEWRQWRKERIG